MAETLVSTHVPDAPSAPQASKGFPPGCLAVLSGDLLRFVGFSKAWHRTAVPAGSDTYWSMGCEKVQGRNNAVAAMLSRPDFQWLWFLDDDQSWEPDHLMHLLSVAYGDPGVDVVGSLYCTKHPPFNPVGGLSFSGQYRTLTWDDVPRYQKTWTDDRLALGTGGLLIKRGVFEKMPPPWFEVGQVRTDKEHEDLFFSTKVHRLAFTVAMDLERSQRHHFPLSVGASRVDGVWVPDIEFDMPSGPKFRMGLNFNQPSARPSLRA